MPQEEYALEIAHRVHYSNREPIPIAEIASSLLALERILLRAPRVFSLVTSVPIERAEVYVDDIASGSLTEDVIVKIFFGSQEELDAFLRKINETLGQHKVIKNTLLAALILGIVGAGLYGAAKAIGANSTATNTINLNNNVIINIGAEQSGLSPEQLKEIILAGIGDKKANAKDAIEFVRPAKGDAEASITMEDSTVLAIPKQVVSAAPSKLIIEANPKERVLLDVDLNVRATNLDSQTTGWAALIPGVVNRRVKLVLGDGVDPRAVAGKFTVRADVIVHSVPQGPKGDYKVNQITLVRLVNN